MPILNFAGLLLIALKGRNIKALGIFEKDKRWIQIQNN